MANKRTKANGPYGGNKNYPRKEIPLEIAESDSGEVMARKFAALATSPELAAYRVINGAERKSGLGDQIDVPTLLGAMRDQAVTVNNGDLRQAEAMLINQATALQTLFARLAERGMSCDAIQAFEANMRMALRAQSQCRATLETLALIKNPRQVAFVKQANIANGPQQVNNGIEPEASRARENENQQSKQSEANHELLPDTRASALTGAIDPQMETLGEIHRAENARG